jgi:hypothetical protein
VSRVLALPARRLTRLSAALAMVAASLVVLGGEPAQAAGCSRFRTSKVFVSGTATEKHTWYVYDDDRREPYIAEQLIIRGPVKLGRYTFQVEACKSTESKEWYVRTVQQDRVFRDLLLVIDGRKVTAKPKYDEDGYGVFLKKAARGRLVMQPTVCTKKPRRPNALAIAKGVLGLPIPTKPVVTLGAWVTEKWLPEAPEDTYRCGAINGVVRIPLRLNVDTGEVRLGIRRKGKVVSRYKQWSYACEEYSCQKRFTRTVRVKGGTVR